MQHKFLLRFIKHEIEKQKIEFKNNEAFFKLFVSEEPWKAYRSNMSNWLSPSTKDGVIYKHSFITAINEKLGLSTDIWGASDDKQKEAVIYGVKQFKMLLEEKELLFPWVDKVSMSAEQDSFISFSKHKNIREIEENIKMSMDNFSRKSNNQMFLISLLNLMYERGEYAFVHKYVFPHLLDTYDNNIKAKKAHIYASLTPPMYREAFDILNSIKDEDSIKTMDLQTSAISNIRREKLSSSTLSKEALKVLLQTLLKCYSKIYVPNKAHSYYTGINLAYILSLSKALFPKTLEIEQGHSVEQIYKDVQKSISSAKASEDTMEYYYASISEIEFQLLLGRRGMVQELEYLLESATPSQNMIDQTQRQMGEFFMDIIEKFSEKRPKNLDVYKQFLEVFDAYTSVKKI